MHQSQEGESRRSDSLSGALIQEIPENACTARIFKLPRVMQRKRPFFRLLFLPILLGLACSLFGLSNTTNDDLKFAKDDWFAARAKSEILVLHRMSTDLLAKLREREWTRHEVFSLIGEPDLGESGNYIRYDLGNFAVTFFGVPVYSVPSRQWLTLSFADGQLNEVKIIPD